MSVAIDMKRKADFRGVGKVITFCGRQPIASYPSIFFRSSQVFSKPVVAQVRFTPPGARDWVHLPREQLQIQKFDLKKGILLMRFSNQNDPELPPPFSLSVKGNSALLSIKGKKIKSSFDWLE
jgi:hypothetical protein